MANKVSCIAAALLIISMANTSNSFAQNAKISAAIELSPYSQVIEKVFKSAGFSTTIEYFPCERSFQMVANGEVDAEFARVKSAIDPVKDKIILVGPIACSELVAFARADSHLSVSDVISNHDLAIAVPYVSKGGVKYAKENKLKFQTVSTHESMYKMLMAKRFDIVIDSTLNGNIMLKQQHLDGQIVEVGDVLSAEPAYLLVNARHPDWAKKLQTAFDAAIRDGSLQRTVGDINVAMGIPRNLGISCLTNSR